MFEIRWLKTAAPLRDGRLPTEDGMCLILQYRCKEPKFYGTRDSSPTHYDWSEWEEVVCWKDHRTTP